MKLAVAEGLEPSITGLTVRRLTTWLRHNLLLKSGGCGWIRTTNRALMRRLLFPIELHSRRDLWSGREADAPLHSTLQAVTVLPG